MTDSDDLRDRLAAAQADNARLRRLLDEAGTPDSLRHALRDTVAMLRAVIRRTADTRREVEDYAAHLVGRLDAIVRVRDRTDAFGEAELETLVSDELLLHLVREGERAALAGPHVFLKPKAAQVLALAVHELATNAVEHGMLGGPEGQVQVDWQIESGEGIPTLVLAWKETGVESLAEPLEPGFGMSVLTEMLLYELGARATAAYESDGLRWTLRIPLIDRIGRLADIETISD